MEDATLLRIYLGESDKIGRRAAYKEIVHVLRQEGLWGATVTRGIYGFGKRSLLHAASPLRLSEDLPIVVEAVDSRQKIDAVMPKVAPLVKGGLIVTMPSGPSYGWIEESCFTYFSRASATASEARWPKASPRPSAKTGWRREAEAAGRRASFQKRFA